MDQTKIETGVKKARELGYSDEEINSFLKKKGMFSPSLNPTYTPDETKGNFLSNLTGSTALGQRIGGQLSKLSGGYSALDKAIQQGKEIEQRLVEQIAKNKSIGKDTSRLEKALSDSRFSTAQSEQIYKDIPTGGVSDRQVVGSTIQTLASAVPLTGALSKVATAGKAIPGLAKLATPVSGGITKLATMPVRGAALEGALGGAAYNFGSSVGEGQSAYDTVVNTALGGTLGAVGGATLAGATKLAGKAATKLGAAGAREPQAVAGEILTDADKLFGNDANLKSAVLNKELFGTGGDITTAPRITAFSDLVDNLSGRKVISLDKNRTPKVLSGIKGVTIGDGYQVMEQRMGEIYGEIDKALKKSGSGFDKQPIIDFINQKAGDFTTAPQVLRKLGFTVDKKGTLGIQPRGLISRIMQSKSVSDLEKIITNELSPELQSISQSGINAPSKSALAGLRQALGDTIDAQITSLGGEYSALKQKYGAYRGLEDVFKRIITGGDPRLGELIDSYGLSNVIAGRPIKGSLLMGMKVFERFFNSDNRVFRNILEKAAEFNKLSKAPNIPELPPAK